MGELPDLRLQELGMTLEELSTMHEKDVRYLFGEVHDDRRRPDSLGARLTPINKLGGMVMGEVVIDNLTLIDEVQEYQFRAVLGGPFSVGGRTKYSFHTLGQDENFGIYDIPGISTEQKAKIAHGAVTLKLLKEGGVDVDAQMVQRADNAYEIWVSVNSRDALELKHIAKSLSSIGLDWSAYLDHRNAPKPQVARYAPDVSDLIGESRQYTHLMRKRGSTGFAENLEFSRTKVLKVPSTEVYDAQMRMAGQIADALNSARNPVDPNYQTAFRTLVTLEQSIKEHGNFLFGDMGLARNFMRNVSDAIVYKTPVIATPQKSGGETVAYRVRPV